MARAISGNASLVKALSDGIALVINRRGYCAVSAAARKVEEKAVILKGKKEEVADSVASSSWVPDPVTGYYRPANRLGEVDAAELREMMLSHRAPRV